MRNISSGWDQQSGLGISCSQTYLLSNSRTKAS